MGPFARIAPHNRGMEREDMGLFSSQIPIKTLVPMCRQLATAYDAGIPIVQTLTLVSGMERNKRAQGVLRTMEADVRNGSTLGEAARRQQAFLPPMLISLLGAGETGGRLDAMLRDLAQYYEDRLEMRRNVLGALALPMLQLAAAWFLGTFALGLIRSLDFSSPRAFNLGAYFRSYLLFQGIAGIAAVAVVIACILLARAGLFHRIWGRITYSVWPISGLARRFALARFFRTFGLLIASGLPIQRCIEQAAAASGNPYVADDLLRAIPFVMHGAPLTDAFDATRCMTHTAREMLAIGETSGSLDRAVHKVAEYHLNEATHALAMFARVARVAITLLVGAIVGYIVISFWSGYYGQLLNIR